MNKLTDDLLLEFQSDQRFKILKEVLMKARPIVQLYDFNDSMSVEKWKYNSGLRDGFDLALSYFKLEAQK